MLQLNNPLEFNDMIQPIKIPKQDEFLKPGIITVAIGWGRTEVRTKNKFIQYSHSDANNKNNFKRHFQKDDYLSDQLQEVYLFTISEEICMELYSDRFTRNMMCAHYPLGGKDSCTVLFSTDLFENKLLL